MSAMQVRSSVLVARTLIGEYEGVVRRMLNAYSAKDADEQDSCRAEVERVHAAIWEQLDGAAKLTRAAQRGTSAYAEIRANPDLVVGAAVLASKESEPEHVGTRREGGKKIDTYRTTLEVHHNGAGVRRARDAAAALEHAWPEVDWHDASADEPVPDLTPNGIGAKLARFVGRIFKKD